MIYFLLLGTQERFPPPFKSFHYCIILIFNIIYRRYQPSHLPTILTLNVLILIIIILIHSSIVSAFKQFELTVHISFTLLNFHKSTSHLYVFKVHFHAVTFSPHIFFHIISSFHTFDITSMMCLVELLSTTYLCYTKIIKTVSMK